MAENHESLIFVLGVVIHNITKENSITRLLGLFGVALTHPQAPKTII